MSQLSTIIEVNISLSAAAVATPSFSIPLIVGPTNAGWSDYIHSYTSPAGMLTDGFTTSAPEYVYALEMFDQEINPTQFFVGFRSTAVEQIDHITVVTATSSHVYQGLIQEQTWSYTASGGDTTSTIATAIASAISGLTNPTWTASASSAVVTVTSTVPGLAFTDVQVSADAKYTIANVTPNNGIINDLTNINTENSTWYGMCLAGGTDADIEQAASYIEAQKQIYIAVSDTAGIITSSTTDVGSILKGKSYKRTALIYTGSGNITEGKDAAWLGGQLPQTPGSNNWAYKPLVGCTPDVLNATQINYAIGNPVAQTVGKNVNIYTTLGGVNVTQMGTMAGGQFIDVTIGIDWLQAQIQTNLYQLLVSSAKIPYTDKGTAALEQQVSAAIQQGVVNGLIDGTSPITVSAPLVSTVSPTQRQNRIAPTISFSCRLAGANNAIIVNGTVTF